MFHAPEHYRNTKPPFDKFPKYPNNGMFEIPISEGIVAIVVASNNLGWEHVSVSIREDNQPQTPAWEEMCFIKDLFWDEEDEGIVQYHPPKSKYVNMQANTLHLWRPVLDVMPAPPSLMVGINAASMKTDIAEANRGLDKLKPNHAGCLILKNGITINYGVISILGVANKQVLTYWNKKGMEVVRAGTESYKAQQAIKSQKKLLIDKANRGEYEYLIKNGFAESVKLSEIAIVFF